MEVLTAYMSVVFSIDLNCGVPSKLTFNDAALRVIVAVCGIALAINASFACGVPGTETSTEAFACVAGIFAKSAGSFSLLTYCHGPSIDCAANQRPESRM